MSVPATQPRTYRDWGKYYFEVKIKTMNKHPGTNVCIGWEPSRNREEHSQGVIPGRDTIHCSSTTNLSHREGPPGDTVSQFVSGSSPLSRKPTSLGESGRSLSTESILPPSPSVRADGCHELESDSQPLNVFNCGVQSNGGSVSIAIFTSSLAMYSLIVLLSQDLFNIENI